MQKDLLFPLRKLHGNLYENRQVKIAANTLSKRIRGVDAGTVFLVMTPEHGNLGDHAIAESEITLLQEVGAAYFEITEKQLALLAKFGKLNAMNGHPILVNGGGNLGTLWPGLEKLFQKLISANPKSSILCLPNTVYYDDSPQAQRKLAAAVKVYNSHNRLKICVREKLSFDFLTQVYQNVELIPDVALFLNQCKAGTIRNGCILCLRSDVEKTRTAEDEKYLLDKATALFGENVWYSDMNLNRPVPPDQRHRILEQKYAEFRSAELVITDRLHGMIFAAITGTPCVVTDSKSPKVKGCYQWIAHLDYIQFAEHVQQVEILYRAIPCGTHLYNNQAIAPYRHRLKELILNTIR